MSRFFKYYTGTELCLKTTTTQKSVPIKSWKSTQVFRGAQSMMGPQNFSVWWLVWAKVSRQVSGCRLISPNLPLFVKTNLPQSRYFMSQWALCGPSAKKGPNRYLVRASFTCSECYCLYRRKIFTWNTFFKNIHFQQPIVSYFWVEPAN